MTDKPTAEVILLNEGFWDSAKRDATTLLVVVVIIGLGVYLQSSAMQWVGFVFVIVSVVGRAVRMGSKHRMTIAEARKRLDEIEAGRP